MAKLGCYLGKKYVNILFMYQSVLHLCLVYQIRLLKSKYFINKYTGHCDVFPIQ